MNHERVMEHLLSDAGLSPDAVWTDGYLDWLDNATDLDRRAFLVGFAAGAFLYAGRDDGGGRPLTPSLPEMTA